MTQTAEGALDVTTNILLRLRELAVQAATDTTNRELLIPEAQQLVAELTRIANDTEFVGNTLLNGSFQSGKIQVGANQGQTISFSIGDVRAAALGERATVTAALDSGTAEGGLTVGEIKINNRLVAATQQTDDQVSVLDLTGTTAVAATGTLTGLVINGTAIADVTATTGFADAIVEAINAATEDTHVSARVGSGNTLVLTAFDGRNISFDTSSAGVAADLGLAAGYFASGVTVYNGESSAIAKVAAIDSVKSYTGVDALVQQTTITGSAAVEAIALAAGDLFINGIDIGAVTALAGDSNAALISAINAKSSSTGVSAALDNQNQLVLTAADGRNISLVTTAAGEAALNINNDIYRGGVKLNSSENFTIAGSTDDLGNIDTSVLHVSRLCGEPDGPLDPGRG
jgi:flagellin